MDNSELRELLAKATPGEWQLIGGRNDCVAIGNCGGDGFGLPTPGIPGGNYRDTSFGGCEDDEALIVAMHAELPRLLADSDELARLRAEIAGAPVRRCVEACGDYMEFDLHSGDTGEWATAGEAYALLQLPAGEGE